MKLPRHPFKQLISNLKRKTSQNPSEDQLLSKRQNRIHSYLILWYFIINFWLVFRRTAPDTVQILKKIKSLLFHFKSETFNNTASHLEV